MSAVEPVLGLHDRQRARRADGLLATFNAAGVLAAADVHVALRLGRLGGESDDAVLLAAALAVRAPRLASVCVDLATVRDTAAADLEAPVDLAALPWPDGGAWLAALAASPLVAVGDEAPDGRPLRLVGATLYLDRYFGEERQVARDLLARAPALAGEVDEGRLAAALDATFDGADPQQRRAGEVAARRRLTIIAGGPGTGKTTTLTRIVRLLDAEAAAAGRPLPLVALAAPTGKAAARLQEAVHAAAAALPSGARRQRQLALRATTLHRLLGFRPDSRSRFRHDRANRLPHDVVIVDETSMVSLSLMARLLEAVRDGARLVLVGDPQQLASVEAGAVLGDLVDAPALADATVVLRTEHRFGGGIAALADAVRVGDADAALAVLRAGHDDVRFVEVDPAGAEAADALAPVRAAATAAGAAMTAAAEAGRGAEALAALGGFRLLCAHRRGPYGVAAWNAAVAGWLGADPRAGAGEAWYAGQPLLVTRNDPALRLANGDSGVVVARADGAVTAVFEREGGELAVAPSRLAGAQTVYAMTIHRGQGSQFGTVAVVLPDATSRILTRELLYTAVTRAQRSLLVCGTEEAVVAALARPAARASGLRRALGG